MKDFKRIDEAGWYISNFKGRIQLHKKTKYEGMGTAIGYYKNSVLTKEYDSKNVMRTTNSLGFAAMMLDQLEDTDIIVIKPKRGNTRFISVVDAREVWEEVHFTEYERQYHIPMTAFHKGSK